MTLKAKFTQLTSMMQDMEHSLKLNLNSKPNLSEIEVLVKKETAALYDRLKVDIGTFEGTLSGHLNGARNVDQEPATGAALTAAAKSKRQCDTQ
jgi:hypothetical protein